jgi:hypothetical protein
MSNGEISEIFRAIVAEEKGHEHGDFLKAFGRALLRADFENFEILRLAAERFISKYSLDKEGST